MSYSRIYNQLEKKCKKCGHIGVIATNHTGVPLRFTDHCNECKHMVVGYYGYDEIDDTIEEIIYEPNKINNLFSFVEFDERGSMECPHEELFEMYIGKKRKV